MKTYFNWSGGKDSSLALHYVLQNPALQVSALYTSVNAAHNRVSMHGVRRELLEAQARSIGLPLHTAELPEMPGMSDYERIMEKGVSQLRAEGFEAAIFGDIFLEDLKRYREEQLARLSMPCLFPLWQKDTRELIAEFIGLGFKAVIVCVNGRHLDESFCGRIIDESFLADLPDSVDPCGENGEYHSFVFDGPIFQQPIAFTVGEKVYREYAAPKDEKNQCFSPTPQPPSGFYFLDLLPA
ncbi:MJ0570-related uncharacterized domain-containing protein [Cnuella takakiae]|uniref:MJ0570-related uncharacterized domain-containing protein n=1 Tax=Cnuella takakiae TaxID=1302690 RepID=A0A1M5E388_9BACT|nr:diphthine--ammonia ligase [Cnuella takakiae]OLY93791.1 ATP-binding protein [Cnuella takakiae]SHF73693.1 MJ0570-related uncharacterized domain-containing protein [Cnuella takakiae]